MGAHWTTHPEHPLFICILIMESGVKPLTFSRTLQSNFGIKFKLCPVMIDTAVGSLCQTSTWVTFVFKTKKSELPRYTYHVVALNYKFVSF